MAIALTHGGTPVFEFEQAHRAMQARNPLAAIRHFDRAETQGYAFGECAAGRWHCWMSLGDFEQAWMESDRIDERSLTLDHRLWDGTDFSKKRVIIRCLHGLGDAIQFVRYARRIRGSVESITLETHQELVRLFSGLGYVDRVISWGDGSSLHFDDWNYQVEVMELPRVFRSTLQDLPADIPYINVSADRRELSRKSLKISGDGLHVGILWASSAWNPKRSLPALEMKPYFNIQNVKFYNFQRGSRHTDLLQLREWGPVHDTAAHSPEIVDTAADLVHMDLLITVDTMLAHLAGALGIEVWTLLPFDADWRWMLNTDRSPWYPTMRLFRQSEPDRWDDVIERVAHQLNQRAREKF